ncbi:GNAT family N-acetyltransferase [Rosenbergiella collisarenosi]|uniref:GNAT family N-acetyltransferase n=1 Tax=Rosenbergiella collisarenosi TaxID=1544695 RepID=UPI001BDB3352|nr:GNAT family N-acetyltransferase [Rosenbergiella collisarenosi]MBT0722531.1 GNAT family N-acetyltransferase [Rosenbergiella collisarenosi]
MDKILNFMMSQYEELPVSQHTLHHWLRQWIHSQEHRQTDSTFSARFPWKEMCLPQSYFLQRKVWVNGQCFLTGPRYLAGDINRPFIDIVASSANVDTFVLKAINTEWSELKPQHIRQLIPGRKVANGVIDQLLYAEKLTHNLEDSDDPLTLRLATSADFDWCRQAVLDCYNYSYSTIPTLAGSLYPIDNDDLMNHLIKGNTYIINHMGNQVGLIVCEKRELAFLEGLFILEEVILPSFRGSSLASRAQRLLQNHLYQLFGKDCLIAGTILPENLPSIRTAEKVGRICVLKYEFLPTDSL